MDAATYSRVMALLEEAKEEISFIGGYQVDRKARASKKITDAQDLLMGQRPSVPEDN